MVFVVAYDRDRVIGRDGTMPWHLPADLLHFKTITLGKPVVMGRKTFASLGRALPGRRNIVLTRDRDFLAADVEPAHSVDEVFSLTEGEREIAVIGGAEIFRAFSPFVSTIYATEIAANVGGNTLYQMPPGNFARSVLGTHPADERNAYAMTFVQYDAAT